MVIGASKICPKCGDESFKFDKKNKMLVCSSCGFQAPLHQ